jgi:hypothetical protein
MSNSYAAKRLISSICAYNAKAVSFEWRQDNIVVRALLWLYVDTEPAEREALVAEIKSALVNYLSPRLA